VKPFTAKEKVKKIAEIKDSEIKDLLKAKPTERENIEKAEEKEK